VRPAHVAARALLCLGFLPVFACTWMQPSKDYSAVGTPSLALDDAKQTCEKESQFRDRSGQAFTDWETFEKCMREQGWEKE